MPLLLRRALPALLVSCAAGAPGLVRVGEETVTGARFQPYTNAWTWFLTDAGGKVHPQGTWTDKLEIEDQQGRRVGRRTQEQQLTDGSKVVTINVFDVVTLAPLSRDWTVYDGRFNHLDFHGLQVDQRSRPEPGAPPETIRWSLPNPVYDFNGGMYGLLLRGFPLREGYAATFPSLAEKTHEVQQLRLLVRGRESTPGHGGALVQTWRVEVPETEFGPMTFWLSDEPPYIIRLSFPMNGGSITYQMI